VTLSGPIDPATGLPSIVHMRGATNFNDVVVWNGREWRLGGTDDVTINFDGIPPAVRAWGQFLLKLNGVGGWKGLWAWDQTNPNNRGFGLGGSVARNDKSILKITWWQRQPPEWGHPGVHELPQPGEAELHLHAA
jgi:hypothetical protein